MNFDKAVLDEIIKRLCIQPVGDGYIDMICPKENIGDFIDEMDTLNIRIYGFTWWCLVTESHKPCGAGGPKNKYGAGWYSEILPMGEVLCFDSNAEIRNFLLKEYPESADFKSCLRPAFWLENPTV